MQGALHSGRLDHTRLRVGGGVHAVSAQSNYHSFSSCGNVWEQWKWCGMSTRVRASILYVYSLLYHYTTIQLRVAQRHYWTQYNDKRVRLGISFTVSVLLPMHHTLHAYPLRRARSTLYPPRSRDNVRSPSTGYSTRDTLAFRPSLTPARDGRTHPACQRISPSLHWPPARCRISLKLRVHANTGRLRVAACRSQVAGREGRVPEAGECPMPFPSRYPGVEFRVCHSERVGL